MTMSLFQPYIVYKAIATTVIAAIIGCAFLDGARTRRTSPRSSRPPAISADAKCTCSEAIRFPDEQREELCEAKSQEGARSPTVYCSLTVTL